MHTSLNHIRKSFYRYCLLLSNTMNIIVMFLSTLPPTHNYMYYYTNEFTSDMERLYKQNNVNELAMTMYSITLI